MSLKAQLARRMALRDGRVYFNPYGKVYVFIFRGSMYTSNHRRRKVYSMDDRGWVLQEPKSLVWKFLRTFKYRKLNYIGEDYENKEKSNG